MALNLSELDGTNGFRLNGASADDYSGFSVSDAGDINGDGIDDLIVGAPDADTAGGNYSNHAGASYVVFGSDAGFAATLDLAALDGSDGFRLDGAAAYAYSGKSVSAAGDFNGDGIDDLIISAPQGFPYGVGASFVVFGTDAGSRQPSTSPLSTAATASASTEPARFRPARRPDAAPAARARRGWNFRAQRRLNQPHCPSNSAGPFCPAFLFSPAADRRSVLGIRPRSQEAG